MNLIQRYKLDALFLPLTAILACCLIWYAIAGKTVTTVKKDDWGDTVKVTKREGLSADLSAERQICPRRCVRAFQL